MTRVIGIIFCILLSGCVSKIKEHDAGEVKIVQLADSTLIHFSYALFPPGFIKETSKHDSTRPITEKSGSFTGVGTKEVLVSVPYTSAVGSFAKLFLVRIVEKKFELLEWFSKDCTEFSTTDIDNDGIHEIIAEYQAIYPGNLLYKTYEIISLASGQPEVVYQRYSEDGTKADNINQRVAGDTLSIWIRNNLIDLDKDSILEMMEVIECVKIDELISGGSSKLSRKTDTLIVRFNKGNPLPSHSP